MKTSLPGMTSERLTPLKITILYAGIGVLWTLFSNFFVGFDPSQFANWAWIRFPVLGFVLITVPLQYFLVRQAFRSTQQLVKTLGETQARTRRLHEMVSSGILLQDHNGKVIYANISTSRMLGLSPEQLYDKSPIDMNWSANFEDGQAFALAILPMLAKSNMQGLTKKLRVILAEQQERWLLCHTDVISDIQEGLQGEIVTTFVDITESELALTVSEHRYREMFEQMSNAIVVYTVSPGGEDFIIKDVNRAEEEMDQVSRNDIMGQSIVKIFPKVKELGFLEVYRRVWQTGQPECIPIRFYNDGRISGWRKHYVYKLDTGEVVSISEDVSARMKAEDALWQEKELAQITLHSIGDAVITTDLEGNIEYLNPVAEELTGWPVEDARGLPLLQVFNIINQDTGNPISDPVQKCIREGRVVELDSDTALINRTGYLYSIEDSAAPIRNHCGKIIGAVLVFHDVTDKRHLQQQLSHQMYHDSITGLPNRLLFNDRLSQALARVFRKHLKLAVLILDIDRFKLIIDTLGHTYGDMLLKVVADRIKNCLRQGDTVARLGGDSFLILLPELMREDVAAIVAQKLAKVFSRPFMLGEHEVFVSVSIGIALYPTDGEAAESLVKHADSAMHHAKELGGNNYQFFTNSLNLRANDRLFVENGLRIAMEREDFVLYYQPQVDLRTGKIVSAEALIRWQFPEKGLIPPGQFIPVAEETGLILAIGEWVLRKACSQVKSWQTFGCPQVRIAINLSAKQFKQPNLVTVIAKILAETGFDPNYLELEITESIMVENLELTVSTLQSLKNMGIRISIDDFGTGFSSLSYLSRLPIDTLKIDQSFIKEIDTNQKGAEIASSIIGLAHNLKLNVIAEGVETRVELEFLRKNACDQIQGYLFSKPVPAKEFGEMLLADKRLPNKL